jgi:hypothetical protein
MAEVDFSQVERLADDLEGVPEETRPKFRKVIERGAVNIKNEMRAEASGHPTFKHFPRSISYDLTGEFEAEIGPDKGRIQGALGNLLYFGRSNTAGVLDINGPLRREEPRTVDAIADVAEDIL